MPIPVTDKPIWYGRHLTRLGPLRHLSAHRVLRHNPIELHHLPHWELALVASGRLRVVPAHGGSEQHLTGGQFTVIPPKAAWHGGPGPNRCLVYWIGIQPDGAGSSAAGIPQLESADAETLGRLLHANAWQVHQATAALLDSAQAAFMAVHQQAAPMLRQGLGLTLLAHIAAALANASAAAPGGDAAQVAPALAAIAAEPARPWSVAQLAKLCSMARSAFYQHFHATTGATPADFLLERRMALALELLAKPGATVTSVARSLGFSSPQYFATCFRRVHGRRPSELAG